MKRGLRPLTSASRSALLGLDPGCACIWPDSLQGTVAAQLGRSRLAFEFRDASWYGAATLDVLSRQVRGTLSARRETRTRLATPARHTHGGRLSLSENELFERSTPVLCLRVYETTGKHAGKIRRGALEPWVPLARAAINGNISIHAHFNRTQGGAAALNVLLFGRLL
jgi:hypothetical protein